MMTRSQRRQLGALHTVDNRDKDTHTDTFLSKDPTGLTLSTGGGQTAARVCPTAVNQGPTPETR